MAVSLVTGYTGTEHVTSGQDGARQAGTLGTGMYALKTVDDPLAATLENANTVTVGPGDVLINGRHAQLTGSTTFAIPVGTQAQQTSNLLVLRYARDDSGVETVQALTLTGDPAASDPQDPTLATGSILDGDTPVDMPLYRVITTGIETAQPVKLFSTIEPLIELPGASGEPLPIANGGTGATSAASARAALGLGAIATLGSPLPVANGGTGATTAIGAAKTLAFVRLVGPYSDARLEQQADTQEGIKLIAEGAMRRMLVGADSYMGMWNMDTSSWLWQLNVSGYDTLWTGSVGSGGTVSLNLNILQQYRVVGIMTSYSNAFAIPALVYNNGSGVRVYGVGGYSSDDGDLFVQYFALRQSGSSLVVYAKSMEVYSSSVGGRKSLNITGILGVV